MLTEKINAGKVLACFGGIVSGAAKMIQGHLQPPPVVSLHHDFRSLRLTFEWGVSRFYTQRRELELVVRQV